MQHRPESSSVLPGFPRLLALALLAGGGLLPAPLAAGQKPAEAPGDVFVESIDVNVVNVDVVVTDGSGRRVTGLTRNDFELREDGKPVEVTNFYSVAGDEPTAPAAEAAAPGEPSLVPEEQRLILTVYLDNRNLTPPVRNRMIAAVERFVSSRLRPDDRLLLATYDGGLRIRQAPTGDPQAITVALKKAARETARGSDSAADRRQLLFDLAKGMPVPETGQGPAEGRQGPTAGFSREEAERDAREVFAGIKLAAEAEYRQTRASLDSLAQLVDSLSGLPGRKVLVYLGGGMSMRPGETMIRAFLNKYSFFAPLVHTDVFDSFSNDTTKLFGEVVERANAHRVTFYTLGVSTADSRLSGEWGENLAYTQDLEEIERNNHMTPLATLAAGTGGLMAFDVPDPGVLLDRMREDIGSYYSLGYVPLHKADGKTHKIEVIPRDRSFKVRHREGFMAQTQAERAASRTLSAMVLGVGQNPLDVKLGIEEESKDPKGNPVLSVLVMFPMSKLVLLPQKHVHQGRVRLFVGTRDDVGRNSVISQIPVPISVPNEQLLNALGKTAAFRIKVAVRPGEQTIAVSVRDELGNSDSTATAHYKGSRRAARGLRRQPPGFPPDDPMAGPDFPADGSTR